MHPHQFKHRIVRDLAWVIASPPLISSSKPVSNNATNDIVWLDHPFCLKEYNDCLTALIQLDKNPQALITQIEQLKSKRLGYRFEAFINFWLQISPNYTLLAHNIQLIENKQTLGEVDFIIQDCISEKVIHLEVAVKFYLGTAPFEDDFRWFGTNTNDQLGKKKQHLTEHQTQLSHKYPTLLNYEIDHRYCLVKGRLFYPHSFETMPIPPISASENHLKGVWLKHRQLANNDFSSKLYPLLKHEWLSMLQAPDIEVDRQRLTPPQLPNQAQCCITVDDNKNEIQRVFLLPDSFKFPDLQA